MTPEHTHYKNNTQHWRFGWLILPAHRWNDEANEMKPPTNISEVYFFSRFFRCNKNARILLDTQAPSHSPCLLTNWWLWCLCDCVFFLDSLCFFCWFYSVCLFLCLIIFKSKRFAAIIILLSRISLFRICFSACSVLVCSHTRVYSLSHSLSLSNFFCVTIHWFNGIIKLNYTFY